MRISSRKFLLLCSAAFIVVAADTVQAQSVPEADGSIISFNTAAQSGPLDGLGVSVSVDGQQLIGDAELQSNQVSTDQALYNSDVQVKFDGFDVKPMLNVMTRDMRKSAAAGETIEFLASSNYPAWISRSEIRIFQAGEQSLISNTPTYVIPVDAQGHGLWTMPAQGDGELSYVLRVYDAQGRFDETMPARLHRSAKPTDHLARTDAIAPGVGEDRTAVRNIPIYGGAVTVYGRDVPQSQSVEALGEEVPVDKDGSFVIQRILPPGDHRVDVSVGADQGLQFSRDVNIPSNDWFFVGLADLTVGKRFGNAKLVSADASEFDNVYSKGRVAFYLKGKIKGRYLLTASADTGEDDLKNVFKGLDAKDSRNLLKRLDPDKYYPVYGDGSTSVEDAPTSGKFYVRLERGDSHVMWGNFKASIGGSEYLRNDRALYGAKAVYRSEKTTSFSERKAEVSLYAAQPGTLPQRDVYRGTGGSSYFLKRQDISTGSETVTIEVRDAVTGLVKSRKQLTYEKDYTIDYAQGVIILKDPLTSTAASDTLVRDTALGADPVNLVVQYEYTPTASQMDSYSFGGRGQAWLGDKVRVGVTGMQENKGNGTIGPDQKMLGADIRYRHSENSFIEAEIAQSEGPGFAQTLSTDGGLTSVDQAASGAKGISAKAWRIRGQVDLADLGVKNIKGSLTAYYDKKEAGFSSLDSQISVTQEISGALLELAPDEKTNVRLGYENFKDDNGKHKREASAEVSREMTSSIKVTAGLKQSELTTPGGVAKDNGKRTDGALRLAYAFNEDSSVYVFGQGTLTKSGGVERNDRIGVGGEHKFNDKIGVSGEVSDGTSGLGAMASLNVTPSEDNEYYTGYKLDPERSANNANLSGSDKGAFVVGARRKYSDELSAHAENTYDVLGKRASLTSTYGVTYTPDDRWTLKGGMEIGKIQDPNASDFDRKAFSLGMAYKIEDQFSARLRGSWGIDDSQDNTRDRNTYLLSAGLNWQTNPDWQLKTSLDMVISDSDQSSILDGKYIKAMAGYAYRPVGNDRLNLLFRYGFLYDLPAVNQTTASGTSSGPGQKSHVLSADATYQLNQYVDVGAKYGFRFGEIESTRGSGVYSSSQAHLGIVRADFHVISKWDVALEGRVLSSPSAKTTDFGSVVAAYRHFGDHIKAGGGFNFGRFSDDLTDLTYNDRGVFLNIVGKY